MAEHVFDLNENPGSVRYPWNLLKAEGDTLLILGPEVNVRTIRGSASFYQQQTGNRIALKKLFYGRVQATLTRFVRERAEKPRVRKTGETYGLDRMEVGQTILIRWIAEPDGSRIGSKQRRIHMAIKRARLAYGFRFAVLCIARGVQVHRQS